MTLSHSDKVVRDHAAQAQPDSSMPVATAQTSDAVTAAPQHAQRCRRKGAPRASHELCTVNPTEAAMQLHIHASFTDS